MAKIVSLTALEAASSGFTHKITVTAADVAALTSGTAYSVYPEFNSSATQGNLLVQNAAVFVETAFAFSGGDTGTLVITVGDNATANAYAASTTVKTAGWIKGAGTTNLVPSGNIIKFTPTAATQAITLVNAGVMHIMLALVDGDDIKK